MDKVSGGIWYFLGSICFSALICFGFFSAGITEVQNKFVQQASANEHLQRQIDSLECVINTEFKNKRDTIIVNVSPQIIKLYNCK